jgi:hypothetical protein
MNRMNSKVDFQFFLTVMPNTRPADYYLGCLEGSVFIDFDNCEDERIRLKRISFDRYGCYGLEDQVVPMDEVDSQSFKEIMEAGLSNQSLLITIVKKTIFINRKFISEVALN